MSTSVASVTKHFPSAENGFTTTLSGTITSGATTIPLNSVSGYANGEVVVMIVDPTDATKKQAFTGTVDTSGSQITDVVWTSGSNQTHTTGATVVDYVDAAHISMVTKGILVAHDQDGTHKASIALTTPKITTSINDANGNEVIKTPATSSAVNEITVTNAATSSDPVISATGGDTNIGLRVRSKGTGDVGFSGNHTGWVDDLDTYTYVSSTSFKISGKDVSARFPAGTKIKLTQTTAKYFYVISSTFSTDTTVNVTGGSDYSLANAAITSPYYSYELIPQGFPDWFNWTSTNTNLTLGNGTTTGKFQMIGKKVTFFWELTAGSTTTLSGQLNVSFPITGHSRYSLSNEPLGTGWLDDSGVANYFITCTSSSTTTFRGLTWSAASTYVSAAGAIANNLPWASNISTNDRISLQGTYEAA